MVGEVSISDGREISVEDVSGKGNVRRRNIHQGSVRRRNVRRGSVWTPSMICSFLTLTLQNVWLGKYQSGKCPSGKCPSGMFLVEDVSVGDVSGRVNVRRGTVRRGSVRRRTVLRGCVCRGSIGTPFKWHIWNQSKQCSKWKMLFTLSFCIILMVPRKCTDVNKFCGATDIFSIPKYELKFLCWTRDLTIPMQRFNILSFHKQKFVVRVNMTHSCRSRDLKFRNLDLGI